VLASRLWWRGGALIALLIIAAVLMLSIPTGPIDTAFTYIDRTRFSVGEGLYAYDTAYGVNVPLVVSDDIGPYAWSSDGAWLAYVDVVAHTTIVLQGPNGVTRTYPGGGQAQGGRLHWLPGDEYLLFQGAGSPNTLQILEVHTGASEYVTISNLRYIDTVSLVQRGPGHLLVRGQGVQAPTLSFYDIFLDSSIAVTTDGLPCSNRTPRDLVQSPDGTRWVFGCFDAQGLFVSPPAQPDARRALVLIDSVGVQSAPRWSPDGERVLYQHTPAFTVPGEPPHQLYVVDVAGGQPMSIRLPFGAAEIDWLPARVFRAS
jgi:dipeptidyl aminopeptidase/acylaminoacyl peptidase